MAESVDSEMLIATTWVLWVWSNFTTSIIAPTLFGKKIENCLTRGPSIFELVCGRSTSMRQKARSEPVHPAEKSESHATAASFLQTNLLRRQNRPHGPLG